MLESLINFLSTTDIPIAMILLGAMTVTTVENLFPPAPSDTILLFMGTLIGIDKVDFYSLLTAATVGSVLGFIAMYYLGRRYGQAILVNNKLSFISEEEMQKPRRWFRKWGYSLIIANRFLSGTRAVISFFAGYSKLSIAKTISLSAISALIWNGLLIFLGMQFGENWRTVDHYIKSYGTVSTIVISAIVIFFAVRWYIKRKKRKNSKIPKKMV